MCTQVFENSALLVVVSFEADAAAQEGDLVAYMNELPRLNSVLTVPLCMQVFENSALLVVVSFEADAAAQEGDLVAYMNELARLNSVPGSWQLCKSAASWGRLQVSPQSHVADSAHNSFEVNFAVVEELVSK